MPCQGSWLQFSLGLMGCIWFLLKTEWKWNISFTEYVINISYLRDYDLIEYDFWSSISPGKSQRHVACGWERLSTVAVPVLTESREGKTSLSSSGSCCPQPLGSLQSRVGPWGAWGEGLILRAHLAGQAGAGEHHWGSGWGEGSVLAEGPHGTAEGASAGHGLQGALSRAQCPQLVPGGLSSSRGCERHQNWALLGAWPVGPLLQHMVSCPHEWCQLWHTRNTLHSVQEWGKVLWDVLGEYLLFIQW